MGAGANWVREKDGRKAKEGLHGGHDQCETKFYRRSTPHDGQDQGSPPSRGVLQNGQIVSVAGCTNAIFSFEEGPPESRSRLTRSIAAPPIKAMGNTEMAVVGVV